MRTRSRSSAAQRIAPGGSLDTRTTGRKPSTTPPSPAARRSMSVQREAEQPRRVLRGDLPLHVLGGAREDAIEELAGLGPRGLGVGEIAAPEHVVDADRVAEL